MKLGNLGRSSVAGFGLSQIDLAPRGEFRVERYRIDFRIEAFNLLNHGQSGESGAAFVESTIRRVDFNVEPDARDGESGDGFAAGACASRLDSRTET